jgi:hypothetical protein
MSDAHIRKWAIALSFLRPAGNILFDAAKAAFDPVAPRRASGMILNFQGKKKFMPCANSLSETEILGDTISIMSERWVCTVGFQIWLIPGLIISLSCRFQEGRVWSRYSEDMMDSDSVQSPSLLFRSFPSSSQKFDF